MYKGHTKQIPTYRVLNREQGNSISTKTRTGRYTEMAVKWSFYLASVVNNN